MSFKVFESLNNFDLSNGAQPAYDYAIENNALNQFYDQVFQHLVKALSLHKLGRKFENLSDRMYRGYGYSNFIHIAETGSQLITDLLYIADDEEGLNGLLLFQETLQLAVNEFKKAFETINSQLREQKHFLQNVLEKFEPVLQWLNQTISFLQNINK